MFLREVYLRDLAVGRYAESRIVYTLYSVDRPEEIYLLETPFLHGPARVGGSTVAPVVPEFYSQAGRRPRPKPLDRILFPRRSGSRQLWSPDALRDADPVHEDVATPPRWI